MITGARYDKLEAISDEVAKASRNGALTRDLYQELCARVKESLEGEARLFPSFDGLPIPSEWTE